MSDSTGILFIVPLSRILKSRSTCVPDSMLISARPFLAKVFEFLCDMYSEVFVIMRSYD